MWVKAEVCERTGPLSFKVRLNNGQVVRRHVDHIRKRHSSANAEPDLNTEELSIESVDIPIVASQADTDLVVVGADESEHPEEVENPQNVPPDPPNMDPPIVSVDPPNMSVVPTSLQQASNKPPTSLQQAFNILLVSSICLIISVFTSSTSKSCGV